MDLSSRVFNCLGDGKPSSWGDTDYAEAYNNMGFALQEKSDLNAAVKSFQMALRSNPEYAQAHNNMGIVFREKGDLDAALKSYENALRFEPEYADAYFNMGHHGQHLGHDDRPTHSTDGCDRDLRCTILPVESIILRGRA